MAQAYIAIAPAAEAFMDLVDPLCEIPNIWVQAAIPSGDKPGPSWPKYKTQDSGKVEFSKFPHPGTLSIPIIGTWFSLDHSIKSATVG
jgi:hypothetical protein